MATACTSCLTLLIATYVKHLSIHKVYIWNTVDCWSGADDLKERERETEREREREREMQSRRREEQY